MENGHLRQADIAHAAGVSVATVSLALSKNPRISAPTRDKIIRIAEQSGYRLDQAGRTLQSRRSHREGRETVAIITFFPQDWASAGPDWANGLTEHLKQLGYRLDVFAQPTNPSEWRGLSRSILARGIRGVLLHCRNDNPANYPLPWDRLATVAWSADVASHFSPNLTVAHFEDTFRMVRTVAERGYQQPALVLYSSNQLPALSGGFFAGLAAHLPRAKALTWTHHDQPGSELVRWIKDHRVDVLCGMVQPRIVSLLRESRLKIPEDIALCSADAHSQAALKELPSTPDFTLTGLQQARLRGFQLAADLLHARLSRNDYGLSDDGVHITVRGTWQTGTTLPQKPQQITPRAATTRRGSRRGSDLAAEGVVHGC